MVLGTEAAYCLIMLGLQYGGFRFWIKALLMIAGSGMIFVIHAFVGFLMWILLDNRSLVSTEPSPKRILGRPLLFPVTLTHTRVSPVKNKFSHRVLLIGIPIGFRGRIGPLLSIDEDNPVFPHIASFKRALAWFSFDPVRYLQRGDNDHGLRDKLDRFLRTQNKDPASWPYAYLMSVPRFLWWERNVVSFWYLYSASRELSAMIMEINNSFDEKRNVFFEVSPECNSPTTRIDDSAKGPVYLDTQKTILSLSSLPSAKFYRGVWEKEIFASPFEKVEGSISNQFTDPLNESLYNSTAFTAKVVSVGLAGESKMVTTISSRGPPVDPVNMTAAHLAKFIFLWTLPGTLTTPRIIFQALKIQYYQRLMQMMDRPMIRPGSVARHPTSMERNLESFWGEFLSRCVESFPEPLELTYIPCASISNEHVRFRSASSGIKSDAPLKILTVEVVDPAFYTRVINYADLGEGISYEQQQKGQSADATSRPFVVSDLGLLRTIITDLQNKTRLLPVGSKLPLAKVLGTCRGSNTQMDSFVLSYMAPSRHSRYTECVARITLARRFAMNSQSILWIYGVLARCMHFGLVEWTCAKTGAITATYIPVVGAILYFVLWNVVFLTVERYLFH